MMLEGHEKEVLYRLSLAIPAIVAAQITGGLGLMTGFQAIDGHHR